MHFLLRKSVLWIVLLLLLLTTGRSFAQTGTVRILKNTLNGNQGQLVQNATAMVEDELYFSPTLISKLDTPYQVKNIVTFRVNEYSGVYLPAQFTATVNARLIYTKKNFTIDSVDKSFTINYDTAGSYTNRSSLVFNDAHKVIVKILSVTNTADAKVLNALVLENEMQVYPVYKLSCTDDAVKTITAANTPNTDSTDELTVNWPVATGADVYDMEWTYVDSSAYNANKYGNPLNPVLLFRNNASRVTVVENSYRIPLFYDNGGILFFRVRAVQEKSNRGRIETSWSSDYAGGLGSYGFVGHQRKMNWQMTVDYAEEGKRKAVLNYFDGSLRSRQLVTKDNTTNKTIVSESFYDYQGRPAIQVMPAPSLNSVIKYSPRFNSALNGAEYDKSNYDKLDPGADYLTASANAMSSLTGANQYYGSNPERYNGINQFIPSAGGFAFTETVYTQDNTGRISAQSGVGPAYRIGSKHETRYYYGNPGENDLDVLFGTEAGDRSHYFKDMVQDANGQYAVTYVDMYGRTVATALSGIPDAGSLDDLSSNTPYSVTDTLSGVNSNIIKDLVMENTQSQLVTVQSDYKFKYSVNPPVLQQKDCNNNTVCYIARYDLEIKITDDVNNQHLGGKPFDTIIRNYTSTVLPDCTTPLPIEVTFTLNLPRGNYEISKRLTINKEVMAYYRDSIFMKRNLCTTLEQFIRQQRDLLVDMDCVPGCEACKDSIGTWEDFRKRYMTAGGIAVRDTASYRGEALTAYNEAVVGCEVVCGKTTETNDVLNALLLDVSAPSGQYADLQNTSDIYSIFYQADEEHLPPYKRDTVIYLDEAGRPDQVYDEFSNTYVIPQRLRPEQFAAKFKASWAPALLKFHPEYCKWLEFRQHQASYAWDREFEKIETYAEAKDKGYLNPVGIEQTIVPFPAVSGNIDPLSQESTTMYNALRTKLLNYNNGSGANMLTIWSTATATVKCPGNDAACITAYKPASAPFDETVLCKGDLDMAWRNFRQLYLSTKRSILDDKIKNAGCPAGVTNPTSATLLAAGKQLNFNNAKDALDQNGLGYLNNGTAEGASDAANQAVKQHYEDNCKAYAKAWVQQLAPCRYTQAMLDILIPRLVEVCKEGSDLSHPNGSSSVSPTSTYAYKSFQEVLEEFNTQQGISNTVDCNGYVITTPAPYDKQPGFGNKPIYTKPAPCECEKLNGYYSDYQKTGDLYSGFSSYLEQVKHINMSSADLTQLLTACNSTTNCTYFEKVISLPPALQCYISETCVPCKAVSDLYTQFKTTYPGIIPKAEETDALQQSKNRFFANYMNNHLGFSKQSYEYWKFLTDCGDQPDMDSCTILTRILDDFKKIYPDGGSSGQLNFDYTLSPKSITHINSRGGTAYPSTGALTAQNWSDNDGWYKIWDNIVYDFSDLPVRATIASATLYLRAKPGSVIADINIGTKSHFGSAGQGTPVFERALGPVIPGVTTWTTQPATTTQNSVGIPGGLPVGESESGFALNCRNLADALYNAQLTGTNYGMMFKYVGGDTYRNGYVFWGMYPGLLKNELPVLRVVGSASRCDQWLAYFAKAAGKTYNKNQIDALYFKYCKTTPAICTVFDNAGTPVTTTGSTTTVANMVSAADTEKLLLCRSTEPVFPPSDPNAINNCSDSAFFAVSKGTELYNVYRDSLRSSFENDYINTGLQVANKEVFTVTYTTSEYHYTLYYYNQAGDLVKTVPPAGVVIDRSDAWINSVKAARAAGKQRVPAHTKVTQYRYNTLGKVIEQRTPDAGMTKFWYDRVGRNTLSRDAKQQPNRNFNYTFYDALGRIIEVGQLYSTSSLTDNSTRDQVLLERFFSSARASCRQITRTSYDNAYAPLSQLVLSARNLRNRISWVATYSTTVDLQASRYNAGTFYSYDISGNVDTLLQDYRTSGMADAGNRFKKIVYKYDLISGNVRQVAYQPSQPDGFYHRYTYDAENRLINAETSKDSVYWENDAYYAYYRHGALARVVIGQQQVQGLDYAYTLQGWLKGVNATQLASPFMDMGQDGVNGSQVARDAAGYGLYYYGTADYTSISGLTPFAAVDNTGLRPVFNGNISASSQYMPAVGESLLSLYSYDQLNRLKQTQFVRGLHATSNRWIPETIPDYREHITYDEDGNILTYDRNGSDRYAGRPLDMDHLTYNYKSGKNRLDFITDAANSTNYDNDIDVQLAGNFAYDSIGNLVKDNAAGIDSVSWNIYGKIEFIKKTDGTTVSYTYDAAGNRISKTANGVQTWYVRDAEGNVLSVYTKGDNAVNSGDLTQTEVYLYGSSRLGMSTLATDVQNVIVPEVLVLRGLGIATTRSFMRGKKLYEFSNHLGNVLATISDKKRAYSADNVNILYFGPDIVSAQEYYPFGMGMPGRTFGDNKYRFGFNGQEKSDEIRGGGNSYTAEFWEYDPRIGRRWNLDPRPRTDVSGYAAFNNSPIAFSDVLGDTARLSVRIWGGVKAVGGLVEMGVGAVGGVATSWTGIGGVLGAAAVIHGADGASAGIMEAITGEEQATFTEQAISGGLQLGGVSKPVADRAGAVGDLALSFTLTAGTGGGARAPGSFSVVTSTTAGEAAVLSQEASSANRGIFQMATRSGRNIPAPAKMNWSWKSSKTFGHAFSEHGAQLKIPHLADRAKTKAERQIGQWIDNEKAAEYLKSIYNTFVEGKNYIDIPAGLGRVVTAEGKVLPATRALIIKNPDGTTNILKTGFPIVENLAR